MAVYDIGRSSVMAGTTNFVSATMKIALLSSAYSVGVTEANTATALAQRLGTDLTIPGTKSVVNDTTNHFAFWKTTGEIRWTGGAQPASGSIANQLLYRLVTNDSDSVPICTYANALTANNGDILFTPASDANGGLFKAA